MLITITKPYFPLHAFELGNFNVTLGIFGPRSGEFENRRVETLQVRIIYSMFVYGGVVRVSCLQLPVTLCSAKVRKETFAQGVTWYTCTVDVGELIDIRTVAEIACPLNPTPTSLVPLHLGSYVAPRSAREGCGAIGLSMKR